MQNRNQTMRLSELRTLNERLDKSKSETSVELKFSSDTYSLKACLRYNQREVCTELELLV